MAVDFSQSFLFPTGGSHGTSKGQRVLSNTAAIHEGTLRRLFFKMFSLVVLAVACLGPALAKPENSNTAAAKSLPDIIGQFRARAAATTIQGTPARELPTTVTAKRTYLAPNGDGFEVLLSRTQNDSSAYALLTTVKETSGQEIKLGGIGTASVVESDWVDFVKGNAFVQVSLQSKNPDREDLIQLANEVAKLLDSGENDIPVLVKHLPNWELVQPHALYVVTFGGLKYLFPQHRLLEAIAFDSGPEAVKAHYDAGELLIIEFNTPQISADNERAIATRINELKATGEPATMLPSAYRRVGNYLVFVFDAPSEAVANELIDQVKYQQVVQWLGSDPYAYERATREFTETTLGVFVSVVKASGLALVSCIALGGFLGALLFTRRRAQKRNAEAYSDAGGMVRLNLDEMSREPDAARLLRPRLR